MEYTISKKSSLIKYSVLRVILGVLLMFICSQVQIPIKPVPLTLQTVGVLIIALTYRQKEGMAAMTGYLLLGAIGFPVFAGLSGGVHHLFGATGGYLFGMLLAVYAVTALREKFGEPNLVHLIVYSFIGTACVFLLGIPQLALFIGFDKAIEFGLMPFILAGIVKALFTGASVRLLKNNLPWMTKK